MHIIFVLSVSQFNHISHISQHSFNFVSLFFHIKMEQEESDAEHSDENSNFKVYKVVTNKRGKNVLKEVNSNEIPTKIKRKMILKKKNRSKKSTTNTIETYEVCDDGQLVQASAHNESMENLQEETIQSIDCDKVNENDDNFYPESISLLKRNFIFGKC